MNYDENISQILSKSKIEAGEIYHFEDSPYSVEFNKVYEFYQETLNLNSIYGIYPSYIYFVNDNRRNAKATKYENCYYIGINSGTIIELISKFKIGETSLSELSSKLDSTKIGTEPNNLLYQLCIHFTFYHEMAHLIQRSTSLENDSILLSSTSQTYNERKHLEELDADNFSALCISAHIIQLFENNYGKKGQMNDLVQLFSISCAASISYVLTFHGVNEDFYTFDRIHPHPIIRIACILNHMLEYAQQYLGKIHFSDEIRRNIQSEAFNLCEQYFNESVIKRYKVTTKEKAFEIMDYLNYFRELEEHDVSLSVYKWNKLIEDEQGYGRS